MHSQYLKKCWHVINWTSSNIFHWNLFPNSNITNSLSLPSARNRWRLNNTGKNNEVSTYIPKELLSKWTINLLYKMPFIIHTTASSTRDCSQQRIACSAELAPYTCWCQQYGGWQAELKTCHQIISGFSAHIEKCYWIIQMVEIKCQKLVSADALVLTNTTSISCPSYL